MPPDPPDQDSIDLAPPPPPAPRRTRLVPWLPGLSDAPLTRDVSCVSCDYNLRGLKPTGRCPECGSPIAPSLSAADTGDMLLNADRAWLKRLSLGMALLALALPLAMPILPFLDLFIRRPGLSVTFQYLLIVQILLEGPALVLLALPEPTSREPPPYEWLYRLIFAAGCGVGMAARGFMVWGPSWDYAPLAALIAGSLELWMIFAMARYLAVRLANPALTNLARCICWVAVATLAMGLSLSVPHLLDTFLSPLACIFCGLLGVLLMFSIPGTLLAAYILASLAIDLWHTSRHRQPLP